MLEKNAFWGPSFFYPSLATQYILGDGLSGNKAGSRAVYFSEQKMQCEYGSSEGSSLTLLCHCLYEQ